jgi:hypothetical protein
MTSASIKLLILYRSFHGACHQGLGISALNVQKVLHLQHGLDVVIEPIADNDGKIDSLIDLHRPSHVQISAPWVETQRLWKLINKYSGVHFSVCYHSNIGFLSSDLFATQQLIELSDLQRGSHNFSLAANSRALEQWIAAVLNPDVLYLPNLYFLGQQGGKFPRHSPAQRPPLSGTVRIGSFGAQRPLKNHFTAAAAAILLAKQLRLPVEFYCNSGRNEGGDTGPLQQLFHESMSWVTLKKVPWQTWPVFHRTIGQMHLCIQVSHSESFNIVTADAASSFVPSVVSPAITWAPDYWQANPDDVHRVAGKAIELLSNAHAGMDGHEALQDHNAAATPHWLRYLS